jgi:hypothetical protein
VHPQPRNIHINHNRYSLDNDIGLLGSALHGTYYMKSLYAQIRLDGLDPDISVCLLDEST